MLLCLVVMDVAIKGVFASNEYSVFKMEPQVLSTWDM
jgi:hypothetical protein